jgi:hypothetical protein
MSSRICFSDGKCVRLLLCYHKLCLQRLHQDVINAQSDYNLLSSKVAEKATTSRRLSSNAHCQGFELLEPMLILATELNPGFHYNCCMVEY